MMKVYQGPFHILRMDKTDKPIFSWSLYSSKERHSEQIKKNTISQIKAVKKIKQCDSKGDQGR